MKNLKNEIGPTTKSRTLSLGLAAILLATGVAMADHGNGYRRSGEQIAASGHVEVVHQVPGGTISVGVEIGRPRPVVVQPQPTVVVVEHEEHESHRPREVTIIHEEPRCEAPRQEITVIRTEEHGHGRGHGHAWGHQKDWRDEGYRQEREEDFRHDNRGDAQVYEDGRQFSYQRNDGEHQEHYYRDANQVSYQTNGRDGAYHYYEDAHQVSVQDNRNGQQRNIYVRK